jgi:tetrahydromethanopterin S-methyltransferase subunit B
MIQQVQVSRKPKSLYYLLPGQGRGARKRYLRNMIVAIVVGVVIGGLFAWIVYLIES